MAHINFGTWESLAVGLKAKDGVLLAGTKKISYGNMAVTDTGKNVFLIDNVGFAFAGHVSDLQSLIKEINFDIRILKHQLERPLSIHAIANRLGLTLYSMKFFPYITFALVGGIDKINNNKPMLYSLDPVGSVMEEDYAASGLSTDIVTGILEEEYDPSLSVEEGKKLLIRTMTVAAKRDVYAGKNVDIAVITKDKSFLETVKLEM